MRQVWLRSRPMGTTFLIWQVWLRSRPMGELDESKLTDGVAGATAIFKHRGARPPSEVGIQRRVSIRFVMDISGSMYACEVEPLGRRGRRGRRGRLASFGEVELMTAGAVLVLRSRYLSITFLIWQVHVQPAGRAEDEAVGDHPLLYAVARRA